MMGEHKLKKRPVIGIYPLIVARPGVFRADPGHLAIIIDEPDWPLVAIQTPAAGVPVILREFDRGLAGRAHHRIANDFFSAFYDWCESTRDLVPGRSDAELYAIVLATCFWMAFRDTPGRGGMLQTEVNRQVERHGAAAITLAVPDAPIATAPRTLRWMLHPGGKPEYLDHRNTNVCEKCILHLRPE